MFKKDVVLRSDGLRLVHPWRPSKFCGNIVSNRNEFNSKQTRCHTPTCIYLTMFVEGIVPLPASHVIHNIISGCASQEVSLICRMISMLMLSPFLLGGGVTLLVYSK